MKPIPQLVLSLLLIASASAKDPAAEMPFVSGKDLNGKPWTIPDGLPGNRTLVLIGFDEVQQTGIDTWIAGFDVKNPASTISWIEMPLIQNPGMFMRWFINTGMRGGIPDKETRAHVWSAYTDKKALMKACGMDTEKSVYALVVDRAGRILAKESGDYSKAASARLLRFLHP